MTLLKRIDATIKPFLLDEVKEALEKIGLGIFCVTEIKSYEGKQRPELYRGAEYVVDFLPKVLISITVPDDRVDEVRQVIMKSAHTDRVGDGTIAVLPVEQRWDITTGQQLTE